MALILAAMLLYPGGSQALRADSDARVTALVRAIATGTFQESREASKELEGIRARAIPVLVTLLRDPDLLVRAEAATQLRILGTAAAAAVEPLRVALQDEAPIVRANTALALGAFGAVARTAIPDLRNAALSTNRPQSRRGALSAMFRIDGDAAALAAVEGLGSSDKGVRADAAWSLTSHPEAATKALAALSRAAEDPESSVREYAVVALGAVGTPAVTILTRLVDGSDSSTRRPAAQALGRLGVYEPLVRLLKDPEEYARILGAAALGSLRNPSSRVVEALIGSLSDASLRVRSEAADALASYGSQSRAAVPALLRNLVAANESSFGAALAMRIIGFEHGDSALVVAAIPVLVRILDDSLELGRSSISTGLLRDAVDALTLASESLVGRIQNRDTAALVAVLKTLAGELESVTDPVVISRKARLVAVVAELERSAR